MFVESVQEKEPAGGEGVREGETPAGESGGERTRPLQERIHRYQQRSWKKTKNCAILLMPHKGSMNPKKLWSNEVPHSSDYIPLMYFTAWIKYILPLNIMLSP